MFDHPPHYALAMNKNNTSLSCPICLRTTDKYNKPIKLTKTLSVKICNSCKTHYYRNIERIFTSSVDSTTFSSSFLDNIKSQIKFYIYCRCSSNNVKICPSCKFKTSFQVLNGKVPTISASKKNPIEFKNFVFEFPKIQKKPFKPDGHGWINWTLF